MSRSPALVAKIIGLAVGLSVVSVVCFLLLAIYVSSISAAAFSAIPLSLTMFAIVTSTIDKAHAENYLNTLKSTSIFYVVLVTFTAVWAGLSHYLYYTRKKSFNMSVWPSFAVAVSLWLIVSIVLITLSYKNESVGDFFNGKKAIDVEESLIHNVKEGIEGLNA